MGPFVSRSWLPVPLTGLLCPLVVVGHAFFAALVWSMDTEEHLFNEQYFYRSMMAMDRIKQCKSSISSSKCKIIQKRGFLQLFFRKRQNNLRWSNSDVTCPCWFSLWQWSYHRRRSFDISKNRILDFRMYFSTWLLVQYFVQPLSIS